MASSEGSALVAMTASAVGGAPPTADAVIATKAEPSEDAIGFLYLLLSCPNPVNVQCKMTIMV